MINKKNIIKTSRELNYFRGGYTKLELDFIYSFISLIYDEDEEFKRYELSLSELSKKMGKRLEEKKIEYIFDSLITKSFKINNDKKLAVFSFFTTLMYDKEEKILSVKFNEDLKPHLLNLKSFSMGNLKYILSLNSEYAKRFYMVMCQWKKATKVTLSINEIRQLFEVPEKYEYSDIRKNIIEKAEKQMLEKSEIYFTWEVGQKDGRKVQDVIFRIHDNPKFAEEVPKPKTPIQYLDKYVYHNGTDLKIFKIQHKEKDIFSVLMVDLNRDFQTHELNEKQIKNMVEYRVSHPQLIEF